MKKHKGLGISAVLSAIILSSMVVQVSAFDLSRPRVAKLDSESAGWPRLGDFDILYVDGRWLHTEMSDSGSGLMPWIKNALLTGIPTVAFGGDVRLSDLAGELFIQEDVKQPVLAHALKVYPGKTVKGRLMCDELFVTGSSMTQEHVERKAYTWACERVSNRRSLATDNLSTMLADPDVIPGSFDASGGPPSWQLVKEDWFDHAWSSYGRLVIKRSWYQLSYDGSNTYDWFTVVNDITSEPWDWYTADIYNYEDFDFYGDQVHLVDRGPPDTSGVTNVAYTIGVDQGVDEARVTCDLPSISYSANEVSIYDQSVVSQQLAKWRHDVPQASSLGMNPYTIKPGATIRILPIGSSRTYSGFQVEYGTLRWWGWQYWKSPEYSVETRIWYPRDLDVYVVKTGDSGSSWIGNVNDVESGVYEAVNDAFTRTRVRSADERAMRVHEVTSAEDLFALTQNPPLHAVFINAHGETVPLPSQFLGPYVHITSPFEGQIFYSSVYSVYAQVYPPPGHEIESVRFQWRRESNGQLSANSAMAQIGDNTYWCSYSFPDYDAYHMFVQATCLDGLTSKADIYVFYRMAGGGGGGCPYLSTWDGTQYKLDNNLLQTSEDSDEADVTDYYRIEQRLVSNSDGTVSLMLSEFEREHDFFDQARLVVVDHPPSVTVGVSPSGEILTYTNPYPPVSATDDRPRNVKSQLQSIDGDYFEGYNGSYVTLNFGDELNVSQGAKLALRSDGKAHPLSIHVQVQDAAGDWNTVATVSPRAYWSTDVINMSTYLPDPRGHMKVRLYFTGNHKLDFVGLDTSPQVSLVSREANMSSAVHEAGVKATYRDLLCSDNIYGELTPGFSIKMNFTVPEKEDAGLARTFIFVVEGHYSRTGSAKAITVNWKDWFDTLERMTREYGWIWANVAGYSFYYYGNTWCQSRMGTTYMAPGSQGLRQFLSRDVNVNTSALKARRALDFLERTGFDPEFYDGLPTEEIGASRPIATRDLLWNTVGMTDISSGDYAVASITMNRSTPGIFVNSGLAPDVNLNGVNNDYNDDFQKGYIAAMLAIEESRAFLMPAVCKSVLAISEVHGASFLISLVPGGWGEDWDGYGEYKYIDLVFATSAHFVNSTESIYVFPDGWVQYHYYLSSGDFNLTALYSEVRFSINTDLSGLEIGSQSTSLMDRLLWWSISFSAATLGSMIGIPYLGSAVGLIPILMGPVTPDPQRTPVLSGIEVYLPGPGLDPNDDYWGTLSCQVKVKFYKRSGETISHYSFGNYLTSWLGVQTEVPPFKYSPVNRGLALTADRDFEFIVDWGS